MRPVRFLLAAVLAVAACGGDDGAASTTTTSVPAELCDLADELFARDADPSVDELDRYQELAPDSIRDAVDAVATPIVALGDDADADDLAAAWAEDAVEHAMDEIRGFEEAECDIAHSEDTDDVLPEDASRVIEDEAVRVDVIATDFAFSPIGTLAPGRTSFVLTNLGDRAHELVVRRPDDEGAWDTRLAAPDGDDEVVTFDLEVGEYEVACLLPDDAGRTHESLGMSGRFAVRD